jgi:hypothetical protein
MKLKKIYEIASTSWLSGNIELHKSGDDNIFKYIFDSSKSDLDKNNNLIFSYDGKKYSCYFMDSVNKIKLYKPFTDMLTNKNIPFKISKYHYSDIKILIIDKKYIKII